MPDCSSEGLAKLQQRLDDNFNAKLEATNEKFRKLVPEGTVGDLAGDLGQAFKESILSQTISNNIGFTLIDALGTQGSLLASLLSGGQLAYLGLNAFVLSLLRNELQRRITITTILLNDMGKLDALLGILLTSPFFDKLQGVENLQLAYNELYEAYSQVDSANSQIKSFNYYQPGLISSADSRLTNAKEHMIIPIADAIQEIAEEQQIFSGWPATASAAWKDPQSVWDDIKLYADDPDKFDGFRAAQKRQRATADEQLDTFVNGVAQYLGYNSTAAQIGGMISTIGKNIVKYLPLNPRERLSLLGDFAPKVAEEKVTRDTHDTDTSRTLYTLDYSNVEFDLEAKTEALKERPLKNLNESIRPRIINMADFKGNWEGLNLVASLAANGLDGIFEELEKLVKDVEQYVPHPIPSPDQNEPRQTIANDAIRSIKMSAWKSRINSVQRNLESLESSVGEQATGIGLSYDKLKDVIDLLNDLKVLYEDDNDNTPDDEDAYIQVKTLVGMLWDNLTDQATVNAVKNQVSETRLSLLNSIQADELLVAEIIRFTNSIVVSDGMENQINFIDELLNEPGMEKTALYGVVEGLKSGNIQLLTNIAMGSFREVQGLDKDISSIDFDIEIPDGAGIKASFQAALLAGKSAYAGIADCIDQLRRDSVVDGVQEASEAAQRLEVTLLEDSNAALAFNSLESSVINEQQAILEGVDPDPTTLPLKTSDLEAVFKEVSSVYKSSGIPTLEDII